MENEETNVVDNELQTVEGVYVDPNVAVDSTEIPVMTPEEADEYKEPETLENTEEEFKINIMADEND